MVDMQPGRPVAVAYACATGAGRTVRVELRLLLNWPVASWPPPTNPAAP